MGGNGDRPSRGSDENSGTLQLSHTSRREQDAVRGIEHDRHALLWQVVPASTTRSCHDDPITDSGALRGYEIRGQIGRGVWGTVSEAVDPSGRRVAVKELHASLVADPEVRRRLAAVAS